MSQTIITYSPTRNFLDEVFIGLEKEAIMNFILWYLVQDDTRSFKRASDIFSDIIEEYKEAVEKFGKEAVEKGGAFPLIKPYISNKSYKEAILYLSVHGLYDELMDLILEMDDTISISEHEQNVISEEEFMSKLLALS